MAGSDEGHRSASLASVPMEGTSASAPLIAAPGPTSGLAYYARVVRVVRGIAVTLKSAGSARGSVWSLAKPLADFGILLLVFGHLLKTGNQTRHYPLFLLIGIL